MAKSKLNERDNSTQTPRRMRTIINNLFIICYLPLSASLRESMADEELKKAFQDLQFKTNENRTLIAQGELAKKVNTQKQRRSELSAISISEVPDGHSVYRSIGRMFLLTTKEAEIERHNREALGFKIPVVKKFTLISMVKQCQLLCYRQKIDGFDKQKEILKRDLEEAERNLREMIQARRS
ncbi:hypothetical protein DICVIV_03780 [Dictyocaulus viviparus]|uniref:Prefoldin subunit n=1 Tax=Dictyocaulus viviparus TaxID=29172 RepID=A0A0D8Y1Y2_DICVI|nr:hypothetical protein DICVIV_03780 [Dictyocaulus viviparus]